MPGIALNRGIAMPRVSRYKPLPGVIATRTYMPDGISDGIQTSGTYRWQHSSPLNSRISNIQLVFINWYQNATNEVDGAQNITVKAALDDNSAVYPVYFKGARSVVIEPGGMAISDPMGVDIAAATLFYTRTFVSVGGAGQTWPLTAAGGTLSGFNEGNTAGAPGTDLTNVGSGAVTTVTAGGYGPVAILGNQENLLPSLALIGDSITRGTNTVRDSVGNQGYPAMWAQNKVNGYLNLGKGSWRCNYDGILERRRRRLGLLQACNITHALLQSGINDVTNGRSNAQIQADMLAIANALVGIGVKPYIATITPSSTSTDGWVTVVNQTTHANNAVRVANNNWRRTLPAPFKGLVEVADLAESARDSGLWKASYTGDGLHPLVGGAAAIAAALPSPLDYFRV